MSPEDFAREYLDHFIDVARWDGLLPSLVAARDLLEGVRGARKKVMLFGNGASASLASHYALDFTKQAKVRAMAFNDGPLLTAYGNDYGYDRWAARAIEHHADPGDVVVLISSSGRSPNMVLAADCCMELGLKTLTFTGFEADNPLRSRGAVNFWTDSCAYNVVEAVHGLWLGVLCDMLIGKREYGVEE